jgi:hypothetical protein
MAAYLPQITWALDLVTNRLVRAERAERKAGKGRYRCLDDRCGGDLTVARSRLGRQHFRHFRNGHAEDCAFHNLGNTQTQHKAAQLLLRTVLTEAMQCRTPMPILVFNTPQGVQHVLPFIRASAVAVEWECPHTGRRADVALLDEVGEAVLLIEVLHTHAVTPEKRSDLSRYWWIEVEARQVIADASKLVVCNHDNLPEVLALQWEQFKLFECV